jgi:hypothetical protein
MTNRAQTFVDRKNEFAERGYCISHEEAEACEIITELLAEISQYEEGYQQFLADTLKLHNEPERY